MNKKVGSICILIVLNLVLHAEYASKALAQYKSEDYHGAIESWQKELKDPKAHLSSIYFQIGNAYSKMKNYPQAILHYEKSLRLDYNQEDVKFNIKVARAKLGLDVENKTLFTTDILKKIAFVFSSSTLKFLMIAISWLVLIWTMIRYFKNIHRWDTIRNFGIVVGTSLMILFFLQSYFKSQTGKGVVMIESHGFENMNMKGDSKLIREGEYVSIEDEIGEVIQVRTEAEKLYWVQSSQVSFI